MSLKSSFEVRQTSKNLRIVIFGLCNKTGCPGRELKTAWRIAIRIISVCYELALKSQ